MSDHQTALKHLFQQEFAKMVAVISRLLGLQHIEMAEDIVSETFLTATETWASKGVPENPPAWLYAVAKQKTLYHFRRNKILQQKILPGLKSMQEKETGITETVFSNEYIRDSQLQMLFAVCNPAIVSEAQIGLALRILCGFGIDEIAGAFLSNKETINKRLLRAKDKLRTEKIRMELPPEAELPVRLDNVLRVIYLLFNEGYYSRTEDTILRKELCLEALRLGLMLTEYEKTSLPRTNALVALMCFHASRFGAREASENAMILYGDQDEGLWDETLVRQGLHYLGLSAQGSEISAYHLEARIASWHCVKEDSREKWQDVLDLYNQLLELSYSPAAALNRSYALYKADGHQAALREAEKLGLETSHFYFVLLGELYSHTDRAKAKMHFEKARSLAKTLTEKQGILKRLEELDRAASKEP